MQQKKNNYKISKLKRAQNAVEEKQIQNLKLKRAQIHLQETNTKSQNKEGHKMQLKKNEYKISKLIKKGTKCSCRKQIQNFKIKKGSICSCRKANTKSLN